MKIAIVGWGIEGQSVYRYFGPDHEYLIVNEEPRPDFPATSEKIALQYVKSARKPGITSNVADLSYLDGIENCDKIIYTPTVYFNLLKKFGNDETFWSKTTTALHIFFENVATKNIIGITGTKGKGTTSTLTAKLLEAQGHKVHLGGNIGRSVLDFLNDVKESDWVVLELSNFQLNNFPYSPHIAVCLMLVEEHMDWHTDMQQYIDAKANIFKHQTGEDVAIYFANNENSTKIAQLSKGTKFPYFAKPGARLDDDGNIVIGENATKVIDKTEVKLPGAHNLQNICAALTAVYKATGSFDKADTVLSSFSGLEHRLELVREFEGVKYYDDSFGTTPDTAIVAMQAFTQPKILILGGSDKGIPFVKMAKEVTKNNVRQVIAIGDTGQKIAELLKNEGFKDVVLGLDKMTDIVNYAHEHAQNGDIVLLSTGCASFGLFKDYKDRGNQFKQAVLDLN
jgi:UDP-N-acetylmuramoylalanine--D-glutamate ligase